VAPGNGQLALFFRLASKVRWHYTSTGRQPRKWSPRFWNAERGGTGFLRGAGQDSSYSISITGY